MTTSETTDGSPSLAGLRVVELGTVLAAPLTGMMLADHGADVIKVELPGVGDPVRTWGQAEDEAATGAFWAMIGRNKRSTTLDLHSETDRNILRRFLADADVLIENFRPGTLERWGLSPEALMAANECLIILRMTGWGQEGPYAARPSFGTLVEAFSGFAYVNGWADRPPTLPPFGLADSMAGFIGAFGVTAALRARERTGRGQVIDLALYEPMLVSLGAMTAEYDRFGTVQERNGNRVPSAAPRGAYQCSDDKWIAVSGSSQATALRLLEEIGGADFAVDPRFATNRARVENVDDLDKIIGDWMSVRTSTEVLTELQAADVPASGVNSVEDVFNDPHVQSRESIASYEDPSWGTVRLPAPIPRLMSTPAVVRHLGRALGADNNLVDLDDPW